MDKLTKTEKRLKVMTKERDSLKLKMIVLVNNSKRMGSQAAEETGKSCKVCGQEYIEKENFNWSCRQHTSSWGG